MFVYNIHIWDGHLSIHSDTFSVFLQDVIIPSYSRLLDWLPSTVSHKGGLCGSHSLPVLAHLDFTERVTQTEWHSKQGHQC